MEDFSQSRGDDDLFDDEIIPFENPPSPEKITTRLEEVSLEHSPAPLPIEAISAAVPAPQVAKTPSTNTLDAPFPGFRQNIRGRGGQQTGRGGGPRQPSGGLENSRWATSKPSESTRPVTKSNKPMKPPPAAEIQTAPTQTEPSNSTEADSQPSTTEDLTDIPNGSSTPTGPSSTTQPSKTPAVRGDRTLTGGPARTKLTEEELSAKLAAAKERSQNVAAAHARAQADAASFEERERVAGEKRAVEKKERRVMEGERERNRMRKMGAREGREWDRDKEDVTANGRGRGRGGGYAEYGARGFTGGQAEEDDLRQYEWHEDRGRGRGRGRGDRGGRGRGRGNSRGGGQQHQPDVSAETDFPSLPGGSLATSKYARPPDEPSESKPIAKETSKPATQRVDPLGGGGGGTWADQVESSELDLKGEKTEKPRNSW